MGKAPPFAPRQLANQWRKGHACWPEVVGAAPWLGTGVLPETKPCSASWQGGQAISTMPCHGHPSLLHPPSLLPRR